ncbi:PGN_0703 family putative restriction endonuclease [Nocardioides koreensis]
MDDLTGDHLPRPFDNDPAVRAHRAHQGRWRRETLQWPAGPPTDSRARSRYPTLDSCLAEEHEGISAQEEGLNLMSDAAREYARKRLSELKPIGGLAEKDRLWRNLLSSQPLAFSIAGELRAHPSAAAAMFAELTGADVRALGRLDDPSHQLNGIEAEWFPPRDLHTRDRSGFDVAAILELADDSRLLVTVEVKYVDTFSPTKLDPECYAAALSEIGLAPVDAKEIVDQGGSQFLRSVLLTDSVRRTGVRGEGGVDQAMAVVLTRGDDSRAASVVSALHQHAMPTSVALWSHENFFNAASSQPALLEWAARMSDRYLL